jgi:hypothetical protein
MKQYTEAQMAVLKNLAENEYIQISPREPNHVISFFVQEGLVRCGFRGDLPGRPYCAQITEEGKSYIVTQREDHERFYQSFRSTRRISIAALIISIASLLLGPVLTLILSML